MTEKGDNKDDWVTFRIEKGKKDNWKRKWKAFDKMGLEMGKIFDSWSDLIRYAMDIGFETIEKDAFNKFVEKFISTNKAIFKRGIGGPGCGKTAKSIEIFKSLRQTMENIIKTS